MLNLLPTFNLMATRLETDSPDLARIVSAASVAARNRAILSVVRALSSHFPGIAGQMEKIIESSDLSAAATLAELLDEQYFALDEKGDDTAVQRFAEARAAMAVKFLLEGAAEEALYESIMALDDGDYVEAIFKASLRNEI